MNLAMPAERLSRLIRGFSSEALETRQLARRLAQLFQVRFRDLKRELTRHDAKGARAERMALIDARYASQVDELAEIHYQARAARVQYETHVMLFKARQSLRLAALPRRR